jgi:hypothetical protein
MPTVVTVKMTRGESDTLDWLVARMKWRSRSDGIRGAIMRYAFDLGLRSSEILRVREERAQHPIRTRRRKVVKIQAPSKGNVAPGRVKS